MNVQIGNHLIYSIPLNIVLAEIKKGKDGKEDKRIQGYYEDVESALISLLSKKLNDTSVRTVEGLIKHIERTRNDLLEELKTCKPLRKMRPMELEREEDAD